MHLADTDPFGDVALVQLLEKSQFKDGAFSFRQAFQEGLDRHPVDRPGDADIADRRVG